MHLVRKTSSNDMLRTHWSLVYLPYLVFIKYLQANTAYSIITVEIKGFVSDVKTKKLSWSTYVICKINAVLIYAYSHWELSIPSYLFQTSTIQRFRVNICSNNDGAQCNTVSVKIIYYECVSFQGQLADSTRIYGHLIIVFKACFSEIPYWIIKAERPCTARHLKSRRNFHYMSLIAKHRRRQVLLPFDRSEVYPYTG